VRDLVIQILYFAASILLILGIKGLTRPDTARRGIQSGAWSSAPSSACPSASAWR